MKKFIYILVIIIFIIAAWQFREYQKDKWIKEDIEFRNCLKTYDAYLNPTICHLLRDASSKQIKELESLELL